MVAGRGGERSNTRPGVLRPSDPDRGRLGGGSSTSRPLCLHDVKRIASIVSAMSRSRPVSWSRPLPRPLVIPGIMTLTTLADVRKLIELMPKEFRKRLTWQHVVAELNKATRGGDPIDLAVALRLVLSIEGVPCEPQGNPATRKATV